MRPENLRLALDTDRNKRLKSGTVVEDTSDIYLNVNVIEDIGQRRESNQESQSPYTLSNFRTQDTNCLLTCHERLLVQLFVTDLNCNKTWQRDLHLAIQVFAGQPSHTLSLFDCAFLNRGMPLSRFPKPKRSFPPPSASAFSPLSGGCTMAFEAKFPSSLVDTEELSLRFATDGELKSVS